MVEAKKIKTPLTREQAKELRAGDQVLINGVIYTGRDAAHKRMIETLDRGEDLPFDVQDAVIYYVGPCPAKPGQVIGSAGPTTSGRMDAYAPTLIVKGLTGMIGKGLRTSAVIEAMKEHGSVYFAAIGGAGALMARTIKESEVIAYDDLGTEAIRRLIVEDFPAIVVIDSQGNNLYEQGKEAYRKK
nr:Fe-S-containing hydro-lyase [Heliorestis convoluta]